jgi:hypothetical protein
VSKHTPHFNDLMGARGGLGEGHGRAKSAPMIKPSHKGLLHEKLGVPQGQKIPQAKLDQALHSKSASERKEANFAENFGHKK